MNYRNLTDAAATGKAKEVKKLLARSGMSECAAADDNFIFRRASEQGHVDVVKTLLAIESVRYNATAWNNYAFCMAVKNGHLEVVKILLTVDNIRAVVNTIDPYALRLAVKYGRAEIVKELLALENVRESAEIPTNYFLQSACENGHVEVVKVLLTLDRLKIQASAMNNYALQLAAKNGHLEVVRQLLTIRHVRKQAELPINDSLRLACEHGHLEVVKLLLTLDNVRNKADVFNNFALQSASENGHAEIVQTLLELDVVRNNSNTWFNYALASASKKGHTEVVKILLTLDWQVEHAFEWNNYALRLAAEHGHSDVIKMLLAINTVREYANAVENEALRLAIKNDHTKVIELLLSVKSIVTALNEENLLGMLNNKKLVLPPVLINRLMHVVGRPSIANSSKWSTETWFECVKSHLAKPKRQDNPYGIAKFILDRHQQYLEIKQEEAGNFGHLQGNSESSMEDDLLKKSEKHFNEVIQPGLHKQFESLGDNLQARLIAAELKIRSLILKQIKQIAVSDHDEVIIDFIESNQEKIFHDEALIAEARRLFTSKTIASHTAWRCYDSQAENRGWDNLFISPPAEGENTPIFTTRASFERSLTLLEASNIIREHAAYYYLLVENESDAERKQIMEEDFVLYLAEIRRAHNVNDRASDNPSCFPGTLTRLACIAQKSSLFECSIEKQTVLEALLIEQVEKTFEHILNQEELLERFKACFPNIDSPCELCAEISDAITGISYDNALDILINEAKTNVGYSITVFTSAHVNARAMFCNIMVEADNFQDNLNQFVVKIENGLKKTNKDWFITPVDRAYILFFVTSLSQEPVSGRLAALYSRTFCETEELVQPKKKSNIFETKLAYLKRQYLSNPQIQKDSRFINQCKKLKEQQVLFKKIKGMPLNQFYSDEEIENAVTELTAIPNYLQLKVLITLQAMRESQEMQPMPSFFSAGSRKHSAPVRLSQISQNLLSNDAENLNSYLESIKSCDLLRENLDQIIKIIKSFSDIHSNILTV